jgi:hypothetical protein
MRDSWDRNSLSSSANSTMMAGRGSYMKNTRNKIQQQSGGGRRKFNS